MKSISAVFRLALFTLVMLFSLPALAQDANCWDADGDGNGHNENGYCKADGSAVADLTDDPRGFYAWWNANPANEKVESYELQVEIEKSGQWVVIARPKFNEVTVTLASAGLVVGDNFCLRLVATRANERSDPGDPTCSFVDTGNVTPLTKPTGFININLI